MWLEALRYLRAEEIPDEGLLAFRETAGFVGWAAAFGILCLRRQHMLDWKDHTLALWRATLPAERILVAELQRRGFRQRAQSSQKRLDRLMECAPKGCRPWPTKLTRTERQHVAELWATARTAWKRIAHDKALAERLSRPPELPFLFLERVSEDPEDGSVVSTYFESYKGTSAMIGVGSSHRASLATVGYELGHHLAQSTFGSSGPLPYSWYLWSPREMIARSAASIAAGDAPTAALRDLPEFSTNDFAAAVKRRIRIARANARRSMNLEKKRGWESFVAYWKRRGPEFVGLWSRSASEVADARGEGAR